MPNIVELYKSVGGGGGHAIFMGLSIYRFFGIKISGRAIHKTHKTRATRNIDNATCIVNVVFYTDV